MTHRLGGPRCVRDFAYRLIRDNGRMTTNEIWAAAIESETRISHSDTTNKITNKLKACALFTQCGTQRQRSARGAISGGAIPGLTDNRPTAGARDAPHWNSPLWDINDLDEVALSYVERTHPIKVKRLPKILAIRIMEMEESE